MFGENEFFQVFVSANPEGPSLLEINTSYDSKGQSQIPLDPPDQDAGQNSGMDVHFVATFQLCKLQIKPVPNRHSLMIIKYNKKVI